MSLKRFSIVMCTANLEKTREMRGRRGEASRDDDRQARQEMTSDNRRRGQADKRRDDQTIMQ